MVKIWIVSVTRRMFSHFGDPTTSHPKAAINPHPWPIDHCTVLFACGRDGQQMVTSQSLENPKMAEAKQFPPEIPSD